VDLEVTHLDSGLGGGRESVCGRENVVDRGGDYTIVTIAEICTHRVCLPRSSLPIGHHRGIVTLEDHFIDELGFHMIREQRGCLGGGGIGGSKPERF